MTRRTLGLLVTLALALFVALLVADAQPARTVYRIGYMSIPSRESAEHLMPVFVQALRARGLVEGENLLIEWRWAEGQLERLPVFAQDLVQLIAKAELPWEGLKPGLQALKQRLDAAQFIEHGCGALGTQLSTAHKRIDLAHHVVQPAAGL